MTLSPPLPANAGPDAHMVPIAAAIAKVENFIITPPNYYY
jgi:hypothetical protein